MFDKPVRSVMQRRKVLKATPETLVSKAAGLMGVHDTEVAARETACCFCGILIV